MQTLMFSWLIIALGLVVALLLSQLDWPWPFFVLLGDLALLPGNEHWLAGDNHRDLLALVLAFVCWLGVASLQRRLASHRVLGRLPRPVRRAAAVAGALLAVTAAFWLYGVARGVAVQARLVGGESPTVAISRVYCRGSCRSTTLLLTAETVPPKLKPPLHWYPFQHTDNSVNETVRLSSEEISTALEVLSRRGFFRLPRRMDYGTYSRPPLYLGVQFQTDVGAHGVAAKAVGPGWPRVEQIADELMSELDLEWPAWPKPDPS